MATQEIKLTDLKKLRRITERELVDEGLDMNDRWNKCCAWLVRLEDIICNNKIDLMVRVFERRIAREEATPQDVQNARLAYQRLKSLFDPN